MRLIDAETLKENLLGEWYVEPNGTIFNHVFDLIDNAPTVCVDNYSMGYQDGVRKVLSEIPQGEWIVNTAEIVCSVCRHGFFDSDENMLDYNPITDFNFKFCPNCGADMRGTENGN